MSRMMNPKVNVQLLAIAEKLCEMFNNREIEL